MALPAISKNKIIPIIKARGNFGLGFPTGGRGVTGGCSGTGF